jgi:UDP-glucose 4-epimerase
MSKILVTGGAGYVGAKLVLALEKAGHEVSVYDLPMDILQRVEINEAIKGKDMVFHLAALAEIVYTDKHPGETYRANIEGANNVIECCANQGVLLQFVSTCCIYGNPLDIPSTEYNRINPSDAYAMSKAAGEYLVKMWGLTSGLKYNILRFGTVYGPSTKKEMRGDMCIQKFVKAAVEGTKMKITGDGNQNRNFIHIDDLVRAMVLLAGSEVEGHIINLAGSEQISINQIASIAQEYGAKEIEYIPERKDDFHDQDVDISKAWALLDWQPEIKFIEGFDHFVKWIRQ